METSRWAKNQDNSKKKDFNINPQLNEKINTEIGYDQITQDKSIIEQRFQN